MDERVHSMFRNEMASQARPSLDSMAEEVLAKGRRARRARTAKIASTVLVAAGLVGAAVAVPVIAGGHSAAADRGAVAKSAVPASPARPGTRTAPAGGASAVPAAVILATARSSADYIPQPPGSKAPTSSAAILAELLKLLPPGATSNYASFGLDHKRLKSSAEVPTDVVPDRPAVADAAEVRITLLDALGHLSPRDRAIIVLRYWEDHSVQTVAELLGLSPGVVKVQSMRALASLRALLGEDEALPAPPA
jgi:RNA polymerase sigma factor (sigma-70 family)